MTTYLIISLIFTALFCTIGYYINLKNDPLPLLFEQHGYIYTLPVSDIERYYIDLKQAISRMKTKAHLLDIRLAIADFQSIYGSGMLYIDLLNEYNIKEKKVLYKSN